MLDCAIDLPQIVDAFVPVLIRLLFLVLLRELLVLILQLLKFPFALLLGLLRLGKLLDFPFNLLDLPGEQLFVAPQLPHFVSQTNKFLSLFGRERRVIRLRFDLRGLLRDGLSLRRLHLFLPQLCQFGLVPLRRCEKNAVDAKKTTTKTQESAFINAFVNLLVRVAGVEPTTFAFGGRHSIQLSYTR